MVVHLEEIHPQITNSRRKNMSMTHQEQELLSKLTQRLKKMQLTVGHIVYTLRKHKKNKF